MAWRKAPVAALLVLATGCSADVGLSGESPSGSVSPRASTTGRAARDLAGLRIAREGDSRGYERDQFGTRWKDIDHNGCDQRNDVLARDLEDVRKRGDCVVIAGTLDDPYSGKTISFTKSACRSSDAPSTTPARP